METALALDNGFAERVLQCILLESLVCFEQNVGRTVDAEVRSGKIYGNEDLLLETGRKAILVIKWQKTCLQRTCLHCILREICKQ